jgi:hypothetical protein
MSGLELVCWFIWWIYGYKGGRAPDEDEKLVKGIERYGTRYDCRRLKL